jgi:hypothetical protein
MSPKRDPEVGGYKYIKGVANLGNDSPLLGVQQNGERSCDGEIELASNPPRFLIVEDESRRRPLNRQGDRTVESLQDAERSGGVQRDQAATV